MFAKHTKNNPWGIPTPAIKRKKVESRENHCHHRSYQFVPASQINWLQIKNKQKPNEHTRGHGRGRGAEKTLQIQINRSISATVMLSRFYDYYINFPLKCHKSQRK